MPGMLILCGDIGRVRSEPSRLTCDARVTLCFVESARQMLTMRWFAPYRIPGIIPFIPRIIFASPPFCIFFIIDCICSNCDSMRFTSCT